MYFIKKEIKNETFFNRWFHAKYQPKQ